MVTDGILSAVQGMIDRFDTVEQKKAGEAIYDMLADYDESNLDDLRDSCAIDEWLKQYIQKDNSCRFGTSIDGNGIAYGDCNLTKKDVRDALKTGVISLGENVNGCSGIYCKIGYIGNNIFCLDNSTKTLDDFKGKYSDDDVVDMIYERIKSPEVAKCYGIDYVAW